MITPMIIVGINTRVVEELLSSLIAKVINIGTQIAIVRASITSSIAQVPELNIWSKTPTILVKLKSGTFTNGNPGVIDELFIHNGKYG